MRNPAPLALLALITATTLVACAPARDSGAGPGRLAEGKTFVAALSADPGGIDPYMSLDLNVMTVDAFLYATLINTDAKGQLDSGLAEKWEYDADRATFELRKGLTCADGSPLTAEDIAAVINKVGDPKGGTVLTGVQIPAGTTAVGDNAKRTVTATAGTSDAFFGHNVGGLPIVCRNVLDEPAQLAKGAGATGMYAVERITPNSSYLLQRRKGFDAGPSGWHPRQQGTPARVEFRVIPDQTTTANMLLSGQINAANVTGPDRKRLVDDTRLFHAPLVRTVGEYIVNVAADRPTADPAVRKALFLAADIPSLRKIATGGTGVQPFSAALLSPAPCKDAGSIASDVPGYDPAAAARLLDGAGWARGADGVRRKHGAPLTIVLPFSASDYALSTATVELTRDNWVKLGVEVKMQPAEGQSYMDILYKTHEWDVTQLPLAASLPTTLVPFFSGPTTPEGANFGSVRNSTYEAAVGRARKLAGSAGCKDWLDGERALVQDGVLMPYAADDQGAFGHKASFEYTSTYNPTSIRMYE